MKCINCGHEFEKGNFCPRCGTRQIPEAPKPEPAPVYQPPVQQAAPHPIEENPYEENYQSQIPEPQPAPEPQPVQYAQPVQQAPEAAAQPQYQYQQPYGQQYAYPNPPKKGMTWGKIIALILGIVLGVGIIQFAVPYGLMACFVVGEYNGETVVDKTHYSTNSVVAKGDFEYSLSDIEYTDTFNGKKIEDGKSYLKLTLNAKNISDNSVYDYSTYKLYADDVLCKSYDYSDDFSNDYDSISSGKTVKNELVYIVPNNAGTLALTVDTNSDNPFEENCQFTFTIK